MQYEKGGGREKQEQGTSRTLVEVMRENQEEGMFNAKAV